MPSKDTKQLALYHYDTCPYCAKVKRFIKNKPLQIEQLNVQQDPVRLNELINKGGKKQVPCLRICSQNGNDIWLYESDEIVRFLDVYLQNGSESLGVVNG